MTKYLSEEPKYKGRDGREYPDIESLRQADEEYMKINFPFIGRDGRKYRTSREVIEADRRYIKEFLLNDVEEKIAR